MIRYFQLEEVKLLYVPYGPWQRQRVRVTKQKGEEEEEPNLPNLEENLVEGEKERENGEEGEEEREEKSNWY